MLKEKATKIIDSLARLLAKLAAGAPAVKAHGQGAYNPGAPGLRSAGDCRWNDPPLLADREKTLVAGGGREWRGNFPAYTLHRWGSRLPRENREILVASGVDDETVLRWLVEIPGVSGVTLAGTTNEGKPPAAAHAWKRFSREPWDNLTVPPGGFHLAVSHDALGRNADLEGVLTAMAQALSPVGLLAAREYVGPNRYQFTNEQLDLANALLRLLLPAARRDVAGRVRENQTPPPLGWLLEADPPAAVRSEAVRGAVCAEFTVVEEAELGGTVMMPLLAGIAHNFLGDAPECVTPLAAAFTVEQALLRAGLLPSDNWFVVARNRLRPVADRRAVEGAFIEVEEEG